MRTPITDKKTKQPILHERATLVLDATPVTALVERLARDHKLTMLTPFAPIIRLPNNVKVVQLADAFFGKVHRHSQAHHQGR